MPIEPHLKMLEFVLPPAGEWAIDRYCWTATRTAEGFGYCRHSGITRELAIGDTVIAGPSSGVTFRASQLGMLRLDYFRVVPERLNGFFTVAELRELDRVSTWALPRTVYYSCHEPVSQKFARLASLAERDSLAARSAFLQLWASCVSRMLPSADCPAAKSARSSLRRLVSAISEKDLAACSLKDLAMQLNCSERHLNRLFRAEFGVSFREKQTQLSLQRACQLLLDPQAKVKSVAYDTGFRHLGFFNALFKKHLGVTPKEWRRQNIDSLPEQHRSGGRHPVPIADPLTTQHNSLGPA